LTPASHREFEWNYRMRQTELEIGKTVLDQSQVYGVRYSPDGKLIAAIAGGLRVIILDAQSLEIIRTVLVDEHTKGNESWGVAWSPDSTRFVATTTEGHLAVFDVQSGQRIALRKLCDELAVATWLDQETLLVGIGPAQVLILDAKSLETRVTGPSLAGERIVTVAHDRHRSAFVATTVEFAKLNAATLAIEWRATIDGSLCGLAVHPDGTRLIVTRRMARPASIHSTKDGSKIADLKESNGAWTACWSPGGSLLWTAGFDQRVIAFDGETYAVKRVYAGSIGQIWFIDAVDESIAVSGEQSGTIRKWDANFDPVHRELELGSAALQHCEFRRDGAWAFVGDQAGAIHAIDLQTSRIVWTHVTGQSIAGMRILADGKLRLLTADGTLITLDSRDATVISSIALGSYFQRAAFSSDGSTMAVASGNELVVLDLISGALKWKQDLVGGSLDVLAFSADDRWLLFPSVQTKLDVLNSATGEVQATIDGYMFRTTARFTPDSQAVWYCTQESDSEARSALISDVKRGEMFGALRATGRGVALAQRAPRAVAISADGEMAIFDPAHPNNLLTIQTTRREGTILFFAPDADRILLLRQDGVLEIFDGSSVEDAKDLSGR